jgi:hypothetical protein
MRIEFGAYQAWPHPDHTVLGGQVHAGDVRLGDVFTELAWRPWLAEPVNGSLVGEPTTRRAVALRVEGIEAYRDQLDCLPSGMTGALKLTGPGQELLGAVDPAARDGGWVLVGKRAAEPPTFS